MTINGGTVMAQAAATGAGIGGGYYDHGIVNHQTRRTRPRAGAALAGIGGSYNQKRQRTSTVARFTVKGGLDAQASAAATSVPAARWPSTAAFVSGSEPWPRRGHRQCLRSKRGRNGYNLRRYGHGYGRRLCRRYRWGNNGGGCAVEISGGTVTATGGQYGAGIGGGYGGTGGTNIISGGTVAATGGRYGAGIGGGLGGAGGAVTISGVILTATGSDFYGAGIGGGGGGGGGVVTISGGTVTANGVLLGAGIGSGGYADASSGGDGGTVTITGGSVTAGGGDFAAGIGGGDGDAGGTTTISGGEITATGGQYGTGIGGGTTTGSSNVNTIENAGRAHGDITADGLRDRRQVCRGHRGVPASSAGSEGQS